MVDNVNPTNQFHPYEKPTAVPHSELPETGLSGLLKKAGVSESSIATVKDSMRGLNLESARTYAKANPGKVLGGLAALVIGMGMMRGRGRKPTTKPM